MTDRRAIVDADAFVAIDIDTQGAVAAATQKLDADQFFRILGDLTRLRALALLSREGELCVCELQALLGLAQPTSEPWPHAVGRGGHPGERHDRGKPLWQAETQEHAMPAVFTRRRMLGLMIAKEKLHPYCFS